MNLVKNIRKNTIFLLGITIIVLFFILKDDFDSIITALKSMDYLYILIAIIFYFLSVVIKAYVTYKSIADKNKISLKEAVKHNVITQFFNGITPFSTGGQPMEIYLLTEHDIKLSHATNITIQNFIFYQTALVIYGILAVLYNAIFHLFPNVPFLKNLVLLGFLINVLVAVALFLITFSKKITRSITHSVIGILSKVKLIKSKEETIDNIDNRLEEFHKSAKQLRSRKKLFFGGVFFNLLSLTCLYIVPLFIVYGLHNFSSLNIPDTLTSSAYVLIIGSFVPIPGASGGIEYGFLKFFGNFLNTNIISAVLIIWRFITYYLGMIIGSLVFSFEKKVK